MSVMNDKKLREWASENMKPLTDNVNPASYDLTLGSFIREPMWYWGNSVTRYLCYLIEKADKVPSKYLDVEMVVKTGKRTFRKWNKPMLFTEYTLWPGQFVLCHSAEITKIPLNYIALLFCKSSTGRMGLEHLHAGYGDPGFDGQWTWEFTNTAKWPVKLVAGSRLMQICLIKMNGAPSLDYSQTGRYNGQMGPTPAK